MGLTAWDRYPVRPGEWWAAGPHRFLCGDIEAGAFATLVAALPAPAALVYTDPPWGQGNAAYWRTVAARAGVPAAPASYDRLLQAIGAGAAASGAPAVWVEIGVRWATEAAATLAPYLPPLAAVWTVTYGRPPRPNVLLGFSARPIAGDASGLHGEAVTAWVFARQSVPGGIVLDPCVGRGMTARFAHRSGMACWGCELHPGRLAVTLDWLGRRGLPVARYTGTGDDRWPG